MDPISLDEFVTNERLRLDKFERMWREEHASMGHEYPMVMHLGEWDEQFHIFDAE